MAASRLGQRAQDIFSRDVVSMTTRLNATHTARLFSTSVALSRVNRVTRNAYAKSPSPSVTQRLQRMQGVESHQLPMFLPGTFVLPLVSRLPRNPKVLLPFLKNYIKQRGIDSFSSWMAKFASIPKFLSRPVFKFKNSSAVLAAKALHRSMSEAFAAGDKLTVQKVCTDRIADTLVSRIEARPNGTRYSWELVRYNKTWRYPRIVSQKLAKMDQGTDVPMIRQVVVRICSRQRKVQLDSKGNPVPGTEKEIDLVENVGISAVINARTWEQGEWRIVGTFKDTDPESWAEEKKLVDGMEAQEMSKYKAGAN